VFERILNGLDELYITDEMIKEIASVMKNGKFMVNGKKIEDHVKTI
jgi:hypothetical protein